MKQLVLLSAAMFASSVQAWNCEHARDIDLSVDVSGSAQLAVNAGPGDLEVVGIPSGDGVAFVAAVASVATCVARVLHPVGSVLVRWLG